MISKYSRRRSTSPGALTTHEAIRADESLLTTAIDLCDLRAMGFAEDLLGQLEHARATAEAVRFGPVSPRDVVGSYHCSKTFRASRFAATGESLLFSRFIAHTIGVSRAAASHTRIIDLACGASLPTLSALLHTHKAGEVPQLVGVDIDPQAVVASRENAAALGLGKSSTFIEDNLLAFMNNPTHLSNAMIVTNPPYVPVPDTVTDPWFLPIHGGEDGLRFIKPILAAPMPPKTQIVLFANSLSSPVHLFETIAQLFDISRLCTYLAPFGLYLNDKRLVPFLESMRNAGNISFGVDSAGVHHSLILGFFLSKR